jgi:hypothetical protein
MVSQCPHEAHKHYWAQRDKAIDMTSIRINDSVSFSSVAIPIPSPERRKICLNLVAFPKSMLSTLPRLNDEASKVAGRSCGRITGDGRIEPVTSFFSRIVVSDPLFGWPEYSHQLGQKSHPIL